MIKIMYNGYLKVFAAFYKMENRANCRKHEQVYCNKMLTNNYEIERSTAKFFTPEKDTILKFDGLPKNALN